MAPILEARNITKTFPGVIANQDVSFMLQEGEVLAFLGENGAGKSTLMNVLYGLYTPDQGEIFVRGQPVEVTRQGFLDHQRVAKEIQTSCRWAFNSGSRSSKPSIATPTF